MGPSTQQISQLQPAQAYPAFHLPSATVLIDNGERTGVVEDVIDGDVKLQLWGVDEPGVMIKSEYYGLRLVRRLARSLESAGAKVLVQSSWP